MQSLKGGPLASLVNWFDREYLRPRHRVIAERTVARCISREELEDVSRRLAIALAPYVSPFSFKRRTSEARLARELMDADGPILGRIGPHADKWFESIRELWGWTSRYWEQRALVALRTNHYGRARDFAQQAVGIERHRFPLATAGLTHVVSSQRDRGLGWQEREQLFRDGVRMLQDAVREDTNGPLTVHPYDILLTHVPRIARGLYRGSVPTWLADILRDELKRAEERFPRDEHVRRAGATLRSGALHMS
jgi:hypothetical protein